MKREFLQLAHTFKGDEPIGGWYWSEKLDGCRAFWDGGVTRGLLAAEVPFANTTKDARYIVQPMATGLWSRYGKAIQAPDWWLDLLPPFQLDGELYIGRGGFQELMSTVKTLQPGMGWRKVMFKAFDVPPFHVIFSNGEIDNVNFRKQFRNVGVRLNKPDRQPPSWDFHTVYTWLVNQEGNKVFNVHEQQKLPFSTPLAKSQVQETCDTLTRAGAEGIVLRHPTSLWAPQRARTILKVKGMNDAEAEVMGYVWGRETDKGSKLLGKMGALVVRYNGRLFELSGFTDEERLMITTDTKSYDTAFAIGCDNAAKPIPEGIHNPKFPRGSIVTFKYRELTNDGIPKEARYWRKRED